MSPWDETGTPADAVLASLRAAARSPNGVATPAAILRADAEAQWLPVLPPAGGFYWIQTLGEYTWRRRSGRLSG